MDPASAIALGEIVVDVCIRLKELADRVLAGDVISKEEALEGLERVHKATERWNAAVGKET